MGEAPNLLPVLEQARVETEIEMPPDVLARLTYFLCEKASEWFSSEEGKAECKKIKDNAARRKRYADRKRKVFRKAGSFVDA